MADERARINFFLDAAVETWDDLDDPLFAATLHVGGTACSSAGPATASTAAPPAAPPPIAPAAPSPAPTAAAPAAKARPQPAAAPAAAATIPPAAPAATHDLLPPWDRWDEPAEHGDDSDEPDEHGDEPDEHGDEPEHGDESAPCDDAGTTWDDDEYQGDIDSGPHVGGSSSSWDPAPAATPTGNERFGLLPKAPYKYHVRRGERPRIKGGRQKKLKQSFLQYKRDQETHRST